MLCRAYSSIYPPDSELESNLNSHQRNTLLWSDEECATIIAQPMILDRDSIETDIFDVYSEGNAGGISSHPVRTKLIQSYRPGGIGEEKFVAEPNGEQCVKHTGMYTLDERNNVVMHMCYETEPGEVYDMLLRPFTYKAPPPETIEQETQSSGVFGDGSERPQFIRTTESNTQPYRDGNLYFVGAYKTPPWLEVHLSSRATNCGVVS